METKKLAIWGFYDGAIVMIFDILESQKYNEEIFVVNKSLLHPDRPIHNNNIRYKIVEDLPMDFNYIIDYQTAILNKDYIKEKNLLDKIINIIHVTASISSTILIGRGCVVNAGVVIAGQTNIGNFIFINRNVSIGHHTVIGDYTTINPGSNIAGNVSIGQDCYIGIGTTINNSIKIGNHTVIGAGSVVVKNIPDNVIAYGNPCKIIRKK